MTESATKTNTPSVLFIESRDAVREEVAPLLTGLAPTVHFAGSEREARELFEQRSPGVVISDARLGEASGVEIIRAFRAARPSIKLIVLASPDDPASLTAAANAGVERLLTKPVDRAALAEALGACTKRIAEEAARAAELTTRLRLATSLEHSRTPMALLDREGAITHANPALGSVTGRPPGELIGAAIDALQPPDAIRPISGARLFELTLSDAFRREMDIVRPDGKTTHHEVFISPREAEEEADRGYIAFFADFNRQKHERDALVEEKNAARDFLGLIPDSLMRLKKSHEIMKDAVKKGLGLEADPAREALGLVGDAARRLKTILAHSLPAWRRDEPVEEAFTLHGLTEMIRRAIRSRTSTRRAKIFCKIPGYLPMALVGDASRIHQALLALVHNSIRLAGGNRIELGVDLKTKTEETVLLQFSVANDHAPGAGKERYDDLSGYMAFMDDSDAEAEAPATKEGLALAKQLAESMNGVLWIKSGAEKGRTFYMTSQFKLVREKSETAPETVPDPGAEASPREESMVSYRILVAEDNKIDRKIVRRILEKMGHEVITAPDGKEAVAAAESHTFDLILMDILMPEIDGLEATRLIRKRERALGAARNVPIIALTSHSLDAIRDSCLASGMDACLAKPLQPLKAREIINKLLHTPGAGEEAAAPPAASVDPDFNLEVLLETLEFDIDLTREIVLTFNIQAPSQLDKLKESLLGGDASLILDQADRFKGLALKARAERLASAIATLEKQTMQKKHIDAAEWTHRLDEALAAAQLEMSHVNWENALEKAKKSGGVDISRHILEALSPPVES